MCGQANTVVDLRHSHSHTRALSLFFSLFQEFFRKHMYDGLVNALLIDMVSKGHSLLEEETAEATFELARSDWAVCSLSYFTAYSSRGLAVNAK